MWQTQQDLLGSAMDDEAPAFEAEHPPHVRLLLSRWKEIEADGWRPEITPGLPSTWPPHGRRPGLVWYGFAYGHSQFPPDLVDAVEVGNLWGKAEQVRTSSGPTLRYMMLARVVEPVGVQGVRPLTPEDTARIGRLSLAERRIGASRSTMFVRSRDVAAYTWWFSNHGAVAELLPPEHDNFLSWIKIGR